MDMCPGEKRKLTIPSALAFGEKGKGKTVQEVVVSFIIYFPQGRWSDSVVFLTNKAPWIVLEVRPQQVISSLSFELLLSGPAVVFPRAQCLVLIYSLPVCFCWVRYPTMKWPWGPTEYFIPSANCINLWSSPELLVSAGWLCFREMKACLKCLLWIWAASSTRNMLTVYYSLPTVAVFHRLSLYDISSVADLPSCYLVFFCSTLAEGTSHPSQCLRLLSTWHVL